MNPGVSDKSVVRHSSQGSSGSCGLGSVVASHYNNIKEVGRHRRNESRIFYLRNFNNWLKSMLLKEYIDKILSVEEPGKKISALDLGCGKGGDLNKWSKSPVEKIVFADIADVSVQQASQRYNDLAKRNGGSPPFKAEFITADCTKDVLKEKFENPDTVFDLVSCQFAFHYSFESLPQVECMLKNASASLRKGGFFIGTTPDAHVIVSQVKDSPDRKKAGNSVYSVEFESPLSDEEPIPLFGAKYDFHLEGVVDCPEFLVHFPTLTKLAEKYGLILVAKRRFSSYFNEMKNRETHLLQRMNALETFSRSSSQDADGSQYEEAMDFMKQTTSAQNVGTLSKDEWEAINIYLVFAFKKMS